MWDKYIFKSFIKYAPNHTLNDRYRKMIDLTVNLKNLFVWGLLVSDESITNSTYGEYKDKHANITVKLKSTKSSKQNNKSNNNNNVNKETLKPSLLQCKNDLNLKDCLFDYNDNCQIVSNYHKFVCLCSLRDFLFDYE